MTYRWAICYCLSENWLHIDAGERLAICRNFNFWTRTFSVVFLAIANLFMFTLVFHIDFSVYLFLTFCLFSSHFSEIVDIIQTYVDRKIKRKVDSLSTKNRINGWNELYPAFITLFVLFLKIKKMPMLRFYMFIPY